MKCHDCKRELTMSSLSGSPDVPFCRKCFKKRFVNDEHYYNWYAENMKKINKKGILANFIGVFVALLVGAVLVFMTSRMLSDATASMNITTNYPAQDNAIQFSKTIISFIPWIFGGFFILMAIMVVMRMLRSDDNETDSNDSDETEEDEDEEEIEEEEMKPKKKRRLPDPIETHATVITESTPTKEIKLNLKESNFNKTRFD